MAALRICNGLVLRAAATKQLIKVKHMSGQDSLSKEYFEGLVKGNKVVVFMKGIPDEPRCGFSNAVVQILKMHGVNYDSYDVLSDNKLREGVKNFTKWPTIPQIFVDGVFIGGCDILVQMHQNGELLEELKKCGITSRLDTSPK